MDVGVGAGVLHHGIAVGGIGAAVGGMGVAVGVVGVGKAVGSHAGASATVGTEVGIGANGLVGMAGGVAGVGKAVGSGHTTAGAGATVGTAVGIGAGATVGTAVSAAAIDSDSDAGAVGWSPFSQATAARASAIAMKMSAKAQGGENMRLCP